LGTFHSDKGELHGISVIVTTHGSETWVGRCDTALGDHVVLLGADRHDAGEDQTPAEVWTRRAVEVGFFPRHDRIVLPKSQVKDVRPLGDF
jgi:hypothetical protein